MRENKLDGKSVKRLGAAGLATCLLLGAGLQADAAALKDIFDEKYYADTYADLKAAYGYDREALWEHFVTFGLKEGRNMNGLLDIVSYREEYADLEAAFGDNWDAYLEHFLTFGAREGRNTGTEFNALDYAERYEDLKAAFGEDVLALWQHWRDHGASEGREARDEEIVITERLAAEAEAAAKAENKKGPNEVILQNGHRLIEEFNELGQKIRVTEYDSAGNKISVSIRVYDTAGNMKNILEDMSGAKTITEYDAAGRRIKETVYKTDGTVDHYNTCEYNAAGQKIKETVYKADETMDHYNTYEYSGTGFTETRYDAEGHKEYSCVYDFAGKKKITYDAQGNKVKEEAL